MDLVDWRRGVGRFVVMGDWADWRRGGGWVVVMDDGADWRALHHGWIFLGLSLVAI
jgi:hypothetical protein